MNEPAADYVEEDNEEVVLNRWGKLKQWWDIGSTLVKVIKWGIMGFKLLFITSTAAVVVGQAMDEKPLAGMIQEQPVDVPRETSEPYDHDTILDELLQLQSDVMQLQSIETATVVGPPGPPGPRGAPGIAGVAGVAGVAGKDGVNAVATSGIDDALKAHILDEH